jgi:hypothetical protein
MHEPACTGASPQLTYRAAAAGSGALRALPAFLSSFFSSFFSFFPSLSSFFPFSFPFPPFPLFPSFSSLFSLHFALLRSAKS